MNAKEPGTDTFWDDSLKLDDVLRLLDGARSAAKFVIFDACRNELQLPTKDTSKGLIPVAEQEGLFVAYASSPGRTASDRGDKSGVYAAALAAELLRPGLDHLNLFQNVKEVVLASTNGVQQPWESNGLNRRVYLTGQPNLDPALTPRVSEATEVWDRTKDTKDIAVLEAFASRYNDTVYAGLATARIEALQKQSASLRPSHLETETSNAPTVKLGRAFDGGWIITRSSSARCPASHSKMVISIVGSVVYGPAGRGSISDNGDITISGISNNFRGRLSGDSGSGTYSGRCQGT